jgi:hypothetical protein
MLSSWPFVSQGASYVANTAIVTLVSRPTAATVTLVPHATAATVTFIER